MSKAAEPEDWTNKFPDKPYPVEQMSDEARQCPVTPAPAASEHTCAAPAQARPTREQGDAVDRRPLRVQYRELLERVIQSDPASDSTALRAEIGHALGHTFPTRTPKASPPRITRAQVLAAVNRYIVAIWSRETTEHEKAIDELMRDLGIEVAE